MTDQTCKRCDGRGEVLVDPQNIGHLLFARCPQCRK